MTKITNEAGGNTPDEPDELTERFRQFRAYQQRRWLQQDHPTWPSAIGFYLPPSPQSPQPAQELDQYLDKLKTRLAELNATQTRLTIRLDQTISRLDQLTDDNLALYDLLLTVQHLLDNKERGQA